MKNKNFYKILGVSPGSEDVVITAAYKALMRKYHPDKSSNADATLKAAEINEAYAVLSDSEKRKTYDRMNGHSPSQHTEQEHGPSSTQSSKANDAAKASDKEIDSSGSDLRWRLGRFGAVAIGIIFAAVLIVASRNSSSDYSTETETDYTDATTEAADYAVNEPAFPAADPTLATDAAIVGPGGLGLPELADKTLGPQSPLSYPDIENAVIEFDRVLDRRGMMGAKAYSIKCHEAAKVSVEWSKYDFCVAFDLAAAQLDEAITKEGGMAQNAYFSFMSDNASSQYVGAQFMSYTINQRVNSIRRAVRPALLETISARIAKNESKTVSETQPGNESGVAE